MSSFQHILYDVADGVAAIVLNRPERMNALGFGRGSIREEILAALAAAEEDRDVGAILIRGAGRAFCGGGDLAQGFAKQPGEANVFDEHLFNDMVMRFNASVRNVRKPVIAAVHGYCLGTAMGFVAQCDFVIAADNARFGLVEGRIGHPGASELVSAIGPAWAKFLILTGELVDAARAKEMGIVLFVLKSEELADRATDLAKRIALMPRETTILNKAAIDNTAEASGRAAGRLVGRSYDVMTKAMSWLAAAPDGRRFAEILQNEGVEGMKRAREQQYRDPWLRPDDK